MTFEAIGKAIDHDEAWVAALFYGQVCASRWAVRPLLIHPINQAKATNEELAKLGDLLDIPSASLTAEIGENWFPRRGLGPVPPQDPLLYRLFEVCLQWLTVFVSKLICAHT